MPTHAISIRIMIKKIYGKHIANYKWRSKDTSAVVDRCLEIYELKTCLRAVVWNSGVKGWREEPNKPIANLTFSNTDGNDKCLNVIMAKFNVPTNATVEKNPVHNYGRIKNK